LGILEGLAGAQMLLDQWRVLEEAVGHQAQLAALVQVVGGLAQQLLAGLVVGVHAAMEGRVADDGGETLRRRVDAVAGDHLGLQAVGGQGQAAALDSEGVDIEQAHPALRIAALSTAPSTPAPQPKSSRWPCGRPSSCSSSRALPRSRRPWLNTP